MKPCIQCGRQLPDTANFCPGCGTQQVAAPKTDKWGVPIAASDTQQAPVEFRQNAAPVPPPAPAGDDLWAMPPVPAEPKKKKGFKARYVVLPLLLAVLAVAGVFAYRVFSLHSEERFYDEDDKLTYVEKYSKGVIDKAIYYADGEKTGFEEFRKTDECKKVDTSEVKKMDGVKKVEALELFYRSADEDEMESEEAVVVFGYNWRGKAVVMQCFWKIDDEYVLAFTNEYELDLYGNVKSITRTAADGTVVAEWEFDTEYSFGRRVSAERSYVCYGYLSEIDGEIAAEMNDEPYESECVIKYGY